MEKSNFEIVCTGEGEESQVNGEHKTFKEILEENCPKLRKDSLTHTHRTSTQNTLKTRPEKEISIAFHI